MFAETTNASGDSSIVPKGYSTAFKINFTGEPGTRNVLVQSTVPDGPKTIDLLVVFDDPEVEGICVNICNQVPTVTPTLTMTSDGVQPNALARLHMDGAGNLQPLALIFPAFPV